MIAALVGALVGFLQVYLLGNTLKGAVDGVIKTALISLLLKFFVYTVGFTLLYFFFMDKVVYVSVGFITGVIGGMVFTAVKLKRKGDDKK